MLLVSESYVKLGEYNNNKLVIIIGPMSDLNKLPNWYRETILEAKETAQCYARRPEFESPTAV